MRIIQKVNIVLKTVATIAIMRFEREIYIRFIYYTYLQLSKMIRKIRQFVEVVHQMVSRIPKFHEFLNQFYCLLAFLSTKRLQDHLKNNIGN